MTASLDHRTQQMDSHSVNSRNCEYCTVSSPQTTPRFQLEVNNNDDDDDDNDKDENDDSKGNSGSSGGSTREVAECQQLKMQAKLICWSRQALSQYSPVCMPSATLTNNHNIAQNPLLIKHCILRTCLQQCIQSRNMKRHVFSQSPTKWLSVVMISASPCKMILLSRMNISKRANLRNKLIKTVAKKATNEMQLEPRKSSSAEAATTIA